MSQELPETWLEKARGTRAQGLPPCSGSGSIEMVRSRRVWAAETQTVALAKGMREAEELGQ